MSPRETAYRILFDIEKNRNYSNISLNQYLRNSGLSDKDKGLVTEIVYGVIEKKILIDSIINRFSKIKVKKMAYAVRTVLRMGVYQILFLDRVANYAAIDESVKLIKKKDKRSAGFVNAVLRNIERSDEDFLSLKSDAPEDLATHYSYEKWIIDRFISQYGLEDTKKILKSFSEKPKLFVRVNSLKSADFGSAEELKKYIIEEFSKENIVCRESEVIDEALEVVNFKGIENNRLFREGYISVQDLSSMLVGNVVCPEEGSMVLDLCAAPGGKSTHLAEKMNNRGKVYSQDIYEHKLKLIDSYAERLGLENVRTVLWDASKLNESYIEKFDYVLCDVPCSGMGIVRRKPEIKYKKEEEISDLPEIQKNILKNAAKYVKKGGILVYSTCTLLDSENMDVVMDFLRDNGDFILDPIENLSIGKETDDKGYLKILPYLHEMDGFFICRMKKI